MEIKGIKIGLYARVSSEAQVKEKTIRSQIATIINHAESLKEKVDPYLYFVDDGQSGSVLERPGLDQLRDKALRGEVNKIYILSPDRLSRKSAHQILLIEEMKRLGVDFHFVNRQIGDTPEDQMLLQIQGVVAEYEREKIIERSRRGKLYAAKCGKVNVLSGAPYGYYYKKMTDSQDAVYLINPKEAEVVKEAFHLYCVEKVNIGAIAKQFTNKAYFTRTGKTVWERSVIWGILKNPAYKGRAAFRKTKCVKRIRKTKLAIESKKPLRSEYTSSRARSKEEWIFIPVPAIIDEKTFDYAEQRLKDNIKFSPRNNKKYKYLLSGLLRCKTCGYSIYGKPASNSKYKRLYYRCMGQDGHRWPSGRLCKGHPVRVEAIDDLVWASVKKLLLEPEAVINEYKRRLNRNKSELENLEIIIQRKKKEIKRYHLERSRLIDIFQTGLIERNEIESNLKKIKARIDQLEDELKLLDRESEESGKLVIVIENMEDFVNTMLGNLGSYEFEERRKIVRLLVEQVEVDTINEEINVKHIIPLDQQKCQLRSGRN